MSTPTASYPTERYVGWAHWQKLPNPEWLGLIRQPEGWEVILQTNWEELLFELEEDAEQQGYETRIVCLLPSGLDGI